MTADEMWFRVTLEWCYEPGQPTISASTVGLPRDPAAFAATLAGAWAAVRGMEEAWGGDVVFGGSDPVEAAARLLITVAGRETDRGWWHFENGDSQAEREGYGDRLRQLRAMVAAAKAFVHSSKGGAP